MTELRNLTEVDKEIENLVKLREKMIRNEKETLTEKLQKEAESAAMNPVKVDTFQCYEWANHKKTTNPSSRHAAIVRTPDGDLYIVATADLDGEIDYTIFPGPVAFGEFYSHVNKAN